VTTFGLYFDADPAGHDVDVLKIRSRKGLGLECLSVIRQSLPCLEELVLSVVASPTADLEDAPTPFANLHTLTLRESFYDFQLPDFDEMSAVRCLCSFLGPGTEFKFDQDQFLVDLRRFQARVSEQSLLDNYREAYMNFRKAFEDSVHSMQGTGFFA